MLNFEIKTLEMRIAMDINMAVGKGFSIDAQGALSDFRRESWYLFKR